MQSLHFGLKKVLEGNCFSKKKGFSLRGAWTYTVISSLSFRFGYSFLTEKCLSVNKNVEINPVGTMSTQNTFFLTLKCSILPVVVNISCSGVLDWKSKDEISSIMMCTSIHAELHSFLLASLHGHKTGLTTERCTRSPCEQRGGKTSVKGLSPFESYFVFGPAPHIWLILEQMIKRKIWKRRKPRSEHLVPPLRHKSSEASRYPAFILVFIYSPAQLITVTWSPCSFTNTAWLWKPANLTWYLHSRG